MAWILSLRLMSPPFLLLWRFFLEFCDLYIYTGILLSLLKIVQIFVIFICKPCIVPHCFEHIRLQLQYFLLYTDKITIIVIIAFLRHCRPFASFQKASTHEPAVLFKEK